MKRATTRWTLALLTLVWTAPAGAEWAPHGVQNGTTQTFITRTRVVGLAVGDARGAWDPSNPSSDVYVLVRFEDPVDTVCDNISENQGLRGINAPGAENPDLNWVSAGNLAYAAIRGRYAFLLDARNSGALVNVVIGRNCVLRAIWD